MRKLFDATGHMNSAITAWVKMEKLELRELVKLDAAVFDAKKEGLLEAMDEAVRDFVLDSDFLPELYDTFIAEIENDKGPLTAVQKASFVEQLKRGEETLRIEVWL